MYAFEIEGGHRLKGELRPQGAKNEALQLVCATLLTPEPVTLSNIPDIEDIRKLIELLACLGVAVERLDKNSYRFEARAIDPEAMHSAEYKKKASSLRGSVMVLGPMLARFGKGYLPRPGGDKIGRRRLDTHLVGFQNLGARFDYSHDDKFYAVEAGRLKGQYMLLEEASVTGTANLVMAAVLAQGQTTLYNAACEPYVQQLCRMLNLMGARIEGIGSNLLRVEGVEALGGCSFRARPDMIEVGSFIGLAAMTQSEILLKDVGYEHLGMLPLAFQRLGVQLERRGDDILVPAQERYQVESFIDGSIMHLADAPWPGISPDLLSILLVVATQAKGSVLIHQKMFESRLFFVDKLIDMGAKIILCDPHRATVIGIDREYPLRGTQMSSPDIRAGVALLIAALSAKGKSRIFNIDQIDRGYEAIDLRLNALGAKIQRVEA